MIQNDDHTLSDLLDVLYEAAQGDTVSVQDVLDHVGDRSTMPIVLVVALVLVSPLSGIPGLPTLSSIVITLALSQTLVGHENLWLPRFLRIRTVQAHRLKSAVEWLRRPTGWIDRHSHPRMRALASGPLRPVTLIVALLTAIVWPFLELLPFVTSIGASAVALMSFGMLTRDGLYVLLGYFVVGGMVAAVLWIVQAGS
jgi:hypothetical protein